MPHSLTIPLNIQHTPCNITTSIHNSHSHPKKHLDTRHLDIEITRSAPYFFLLLPCTLTSAMTHKNTSDTHAGVFLPSTQSTHTMQHSHSHHRHHRHHSNKQTDRQALVILFFLLFSLYCALLLYCDSYYPIKSMNNLTMSAL